MGLVRGIFARTFVASHPYLPCVEAQALWDEENRNKYIEKVSIYSHWQEVLHNGSTEEDRLSFCASYQSLIKQELLPENPLGQLMLGLSDDSAS